MKNVRVGSLVRLKVACLRNEVGTVGVVFYHYGDGFQAIFPNGELDGFSLVHEVGDEVEADYFLEVVGFCEDLSGYEFKNVVRVDKDFRDGLFAVALRGKEEGQCPGL